MCKHENVLKLMTGWHCPECGETFASKPKVEPKKAEEDKPKPKPKKTNSKSASK